jgi:isopropylmalate/homocitrate/citramalate synthase
MPVPRQAPVIGENAFTHNAGLHVSAVIKDPGHYELIPADMIGRSRSFVLDQMAGKDTIRHKLGEWKLSLDSSRMQYLQDFLNAANLTDTGNCGEERGSERELHVREFAQQLSRTGDLSDMSIPPSYPLTRHT